MKTHAPKIHDKSQSVADAVAQKQIDSTSAFQFVDNRPETIMQKKLQVQAANSPQVNQTAQLQTMADKSCPNIDHRIIQRRVFDVTNANQQLTTNDDIQAIMGSFYAGVWTFPNPSDGDGCVGSLCVSKYIESTPAEADQPLAAHITFNINQIFIPSRAAIGQGTKPRIEVRDLHLTARAKDDQDAIAADEGNITPAQRQRSAHAGPANDWNYKGNPDLTNRICDQLEGMPPDGREAALNASLDPIHQEIGSYRDALEERFKRKIKDNIQDPEHPDYAAEVTVLSIQNWS